MPIIKWVDITAFDHTTEKDKTFATCVLMPDNTITFEGETEIFPEFIITETGEKITPNDGEAYLRALQYEFNSVAAMATNIMEGEERP